jgi:hypothetical protein
MKVPDPGLYRTTQPYPGKEAEIPADVLVFVGRSTDGKPFVVRPGANRNNRWFWGEPTIPLRALHWAETLKALRPEGFYTLPEELSVDGGGRWVQNAIVQLGYNGEGKAIVFVAEQHQDEPRNVLVFSEKGRLLDDAMLQRLVWAPILPVESSKSNAGT